jgi:CheY-like chemotaxis protein
MNTLFSPRLLIADPCPDNRWSLSLLARLSGCQVSAAATPAETVLLVGAIRPDVLLLEIMMRRAEVGYGLIEQLRRDDHCPDIVVVSGYWCPEHANRCQALGVPNVLKPYAADALLALVKQLAAARYRRALAPPSTDLLSQSRPLFESAR